MGLTFAQYVLQPFFPNCSISDDGVRLIAAVTICKMLFIYIKYLLIIFLEASISISYCLNLNRFAYICKLLRCERNIENAKCVHVCQNRCVNNNNYCWAGLDNDW